eukprot:s3738_g7.t1
MPTHCDDAFPDDAPGSVFVFVFAGELVFGGSVFVFGFAGGFVWGTADVLEEIVCVMHLRLRVACCTVPGKHKCNCGECGEQGQTGSLGRLMRVGHVRRMRPVPVCYARLVASFLPARALHGEALGGDGLEELSLDGVVQSRGGCCDGMLQKRRGSPCFVLGEQANEGCSLLAPPPSDFQSQDHQFAPSAAEELWVRVLLPAASFLEGRPSEVPPPLSWHPFPREWRYQGCVDCELVTPHNCNPFAMTSILRSSWRSTWSMLRSTNRVFVVTRARQIRAAARSSGPPPRTQKSRLCASRAVVAKRVQSATAPAEAGR